MGVDPARAYLHALSMANDFINIKKLTARIKEVEAELAQLLHLKSFLGTPAKRGRKPTKPAKVKVKKTRGKRGALGESILKFLSTKGKEGAHVKDIASHVGTKPTNITAFAYTTGKKKGVKKVGPATFAYIPKE